MEQVIKRKLFGMNGQLLENFCFAKLETYEAWKRGELLFFPDEECFATFAITEERDKKIRYIFDSEDHKDEEWYEQWDGMTKDEKEAWYLSFIKKNYKTLTYEEFQNDETYIEQNIKVTLHTPSKIEGIIFFTIKPTDIGKIPM